MRALLLPCLLGGCDIVLGLDERHDAAIAVDAILDAPFDAGACPIDYLELSPLTSRYKFVFMTDPYSSHASRCVLDKPGFTHLVLIETPEEGFAIDERLDALGLSSSYWVGLVQAGTANVDSDGWAWLSGRPLDPAMWGPNEPNDGGDHIEMHQEDHAWISRFGTGMDLADAPSSEQHYAICECDGVTLAQ